MEVLQCDGCDFRAQSYEDLKSHIQDVHTAFLQPTDVTEESTTEAKPCSNQSEGVFSPVKDEYAPPEENHGPITPQAGSGSFYDHSPGFFNQPNNAGNAKPTNKFFQCKFCVRYFRSKNLLVEHTRKVHGNGGGNVASSSTVGSSNYNIMLHDGFGKVFSCQFCTYKSPRRARILKHQKMYHKNSLKESSMPTVSQASSVPMTIQEACKELPAEVVERSILESMVKPLTKSRGNFCCEWCTYQTPRRERWCDHMMKKHRGMVKILSSLRQDGMNMSDLQNKSSPNPRSTGSFMPLNLGHDVPNINISNYRSTVNNSLSRGSSPKYSPISYVPIKPKPSSDIGVMNLSDRSPYAVSEKSSAIIDMDSNSILNDSSSDDDYIDLDSENGLSPMDPHGSGMSGEPLLGSENNKLLETKGIPFRRYMNRFQCPFCPFLTMHRRSISRHIENIHLSGKTAVYKCDECPFSCKSPLKLGAHKQCHTGGSQSEWETISTLNESMSSYSEAYESSNVNGKKSGVLSDSAQPNPYKCTMCNYSTTTLKGLRVHQQHKHSFCDNMPQPSSNMVRSTQDDLDLNASNTVRKSQTSILGLSSKNNFVAKVSRKNANDFPLDLSPVKKRTRIDEIASNLQSKISQSKQQEDTVINVEDDEEEEEEEEEENEVEIEVELDKEEEQSEQMDTADAYALHQMWNANNSPQNISFRNIQHSYTSTPNGAEIELTLSDDDDDYYFQSVGTKDHETGVPGNQAGLYNENDHNENSDYNEESGRLYYCKHCDFSNKSARSVSTHYQRMHPYIKFSFRYILDPNDHSAVYRCLECYIDYNNFEDLQQHYTEHHPEAMNVLNFDQSDLIYRCRFCSYTSPNVRSLMPHYQRMHPTVKINNAMIFSSYVVDRQDEHAPESQTLREILNSGPKNMTTSTPTGQGGSPSASFNKNNQTFGTENENQKTSASTVVVYDCDICKFASPNMHSVLVHYQKKHPDEKASYFRIQKTMRVVSVDGAAAIAQMALEGNSLVQPSSPTVSTPNVIAPPEPNPELYFCKHCSYSNRSVVGVLVHYQKRHPEIKVTAKYIRQAPPTAATVRNLDALQSTPVKQHASSQNAKKGNAQHRENEMFFCQHCDYGNQTVKGVLIHYQKKHRDFKVNADVVRQHTAAIRSMCDPGQKKPVSNTQSAQSTNEHEKEKLRSLKCRQCSYSTPYVYAMRKHMKKDHPALRATVTNILKWAFLDGLIEAGYHCEWCIYSHAEPSGLLEHYQRRHPEHYVDYTYMATKLCAGPDSPPTEATLELKSFKCRDCTFEAPSIWDITNHYQAFHPWALKGDESVLLDIIKEKDAAEKSNSEESQTSQVQFTQKNTTSIDSLVEIGEDPILSQEKTLPVAAVNSMLYSSPYLCTVCNSEYSNLHGLLTHYGKKHPGMKVKAADFAKDVDINPGAVYKCRHCPYINTRIHGVLTHYQKRHPLIKVTAEDFVHDVNQPENSQNEDENSRIFKQGYGAYRCKICPYTHGTLEKLKIHYEKYHDQPEPDMFSPSSPKDISSVETDAHSYEQPPQTVVTLEPTEVNTTRKYKRNHVAPHTVFRCQLCKYFCSTRKGIARHYRIKHNNVRAQPEGKNNLFKCALCSYTNPIRKGLAAHYQKRHDIDAYYTHCLAASRTVADKPNKVVIPTPQKEESPELSEELKKAIEKKKCSLCSFQSYFKKGIVSHYMKRHPGVFPKKQNVSKLGGYFTTVYAEETDSQSYDGRPETEEIVEPEPQEQELLPFRCIKCFKLSFSTAELLCMHYTDHHTKDIKRDFSILGTSGTRSYTTTYQCKHCNSKLNNIAELSSHLNAHNEDFQKKAKRQERRKQLLNKQKTTETLDSKLERMSTSQEEVHKNVRAVVGYKCKFCVEVHPTLRAICNHLRKHVQYGNAPPLPPDLKDDHNLSDQDENDDKKDEEAKEECNDAKPVEDPVPEVKEQKKGRRTRPGGYPCKQCDRVLMSMQGLRSHERSHLALALFTREDKYSCQFCSFVSAFRHNLDRHIQTHHGHHKPFRCKLCPFKSSYNSRLKTHIIKAHAGEHAYKCSSCSFSTMTISQLKDHSIKVHGKTLTLPRIRTISQTSPRAKQCIGKETGVDESSYSEPPDVQQQLNHYQSAALARNNSNSSPAPLPVSSTSAEQNQEPILNCEFCDFTSEYIQSIRRHYRDKHGGKKLFKCKDCSFYTCFKSAFTMHVEAGHSAIPIEGPKDLRCPFCLYHTKYKHNMIDHIVLHREERVVPIEVCRSKLSKHLQGVVFRCDKCTFTCSSDEALQQHIEKHNELKPYKCQLCYYETKQSEELDSHLREEHKVSRNFELVGLVNLDQLEQMKDKIETSSSDEEEICSKSEGEQSEEMNNETDTVAQEKRFPCEFCGRTFELYSEWERHVLRHGMTVTDNKGNEENRKPTENIEQSKNDVYASKMETLEERKVDAFQQTKTSSFKNLFPAEKIETKSE